MRFVSEPLEADGETFDPTTIAHGEPSLPRGFVWHGDSLPVESVTRSWRSTRLDRGDAYLARHWFEIRTNGGLSAVIYFDRHAKPKAARWWLYTIEDAALNRDASE